MTELSIWLIWSHEHSAWWRPDSRGYTLHVAAAGRFTKTAALGICEPGIGVNGETPDEVMVLAPEAFDMLLGAMADRDIADRRAGAAERQLEWERDTNQKRQSWLRSAKAAAGYGDNESFDVVWAETLKKALQFDTLHKKDTAA